jgi:uncharacterized delta-60 repeat protein
MKTTRPLARAALGLAIFILWAPVAQGQPSDTVTNDLDLMVVYTSQALDDAGGETRLHAEIDALVAEANRCFSNSQVNARYRLVHRRVSNYTETGDWEVDLNRLRLAGDGYLDEVHQARNLYKTDMVLFLISGQGAISRLYSGTAGDGFSMVGRHTALTERWIFTHELAHNLGPPDRVTPTSPSQRLANRLEVGGVLHRTIVAYDPGVAVPYFSGTNVTYQGVPTGSTLDNDVGRMNQNAPAVARFRVSTNRFAFACPQWSVPGQVRTTMVQVVRTGVLSTTGSVNLHVVDGTAQAGVDFVPGTNHLVFSPGVTTLDCPVTILRPAECRGERTVKLLLQPPPGDASYTAAQGNAIGLPDTAELVIQEDRSCYALAATNLVVPEGEPAVVVTVRRGGDTNQSGSLSFTTVDGTAIAGANYLSTNGVLSFAPGELEESVVVALLDDGLAGPDRNFIFRLENPAPGCGLGQPNSLVITVLDHQRPGSLDPQLGGRAGPSRLVSALTVRPDGKVLCGGQFTSVNGLERSGIVQLNADGTVDLGFQAARLPVGPEPEAGEVYGGVWSMVAQPDGRLLVGGEFPSVNGVPRPNLVRFNPDGTLDPSFQPVAPNGRVVGIVLQPDGKIVISGGFTELGGQWRPLVARLCPDGSLDSTFSYAVAGFVMPFALALQPDQKILLAYWDASFLSLCVRLHPNGTRDIGFRTPTLPKWSGVRSLVGLPNGQVLIGGDFKTFNGRPHRLLARLQADGTLDETFNPPFGTNGIVTDLVPLPDGRLLVAGMLSLTNAPARRNLLRLNPNGSLDSGLDLGQGPNDFVFDMAASADGWLYLAGAFTAINGLPAHYLARVRLDGTNPRLQARLSSAASQVQLKLLGFPGVYGLETSADMLSWIHLATLTNYSGEVECSESIPAGRAARFYRAAKQPSYRFRLPINGPTVANGKQKDWQSYIESSAARRSREQVVYDN